MNPSTIFQTDISSAITLVYVCIVVIVGIIGTVNVAVLHKHAERASVARGITLVFVVLFLLICVLSGITIIQHMTNAHA